MQDLTVDLENKPGTLAKLGQTLGDAGINIEGVCAVSGPAGDVVHILVDSAQLARAALADAGISCSGERNVEVISVVDEPGEMGRHLRKVADAGVNVDLVYLATATGWCLARPMPTRLRAAVHGQ